MNNLFSGQQLRRVSAIVCALTLLSACAGADRDPNDGILDPYETRNRNVHNFNKSLDRAIIRPVARTYSAVLPDPVEDGISNVADNLGEPAVAVNSLLQGDLRGVGISTLRFALNTTIGLGGLFDAAGKLEVAEHDTDFGETLHVWGAPEGAYLERPVLGPSTVRDSVGSFVDLFTNPLDYALDEPERYTGTVTSVAQRIGDRGRFSDTVDSVLYDSADSYAQSRLIYLQNRRFELGQDASADSVDPYADPYADPYEDPYVE